MSRVVIAITSLLIGLIAGSVLTVIFALIFAQKPATPAGDTLFATTPERTSPTHPHLLTDGAPDSPATPGGGGRESAAPDDLSSLLKLSSPSGINSRLMLAIQSLSLPQIQQLTGELTRSPRANQPRVWQIRRAAYDRWADLDPAGAWKSAIAIPNAHVRNTLARSTMAIISKRDQSLGRQLLETLPEGGLRRLAINGLLEGAAASSPHLTFDLIEETPHRAQALFNHWAQADPHDAIAGLDQLEGVARDQALYGLVSGLANSDPHRAIDFIQGIEDDRRRATAWEQAASILAGAAPEKAIEALLEFPAGRTRSNLIGSLASGWTQSDPEGAYRWMEGLNVSEKIQALEQSQYATRKQKAHGALLQSLPPSEKRSELMNTFIGQWTDQDPRAARAWAEDLPPGEDRNSAMERVMQHLTYTNPAEAAALISESGVTQGNLYQTAYTLANWIQKEPAAAKRWIENLDLSTTDRTQVYKNAVHQWAAADAPAAAAFALSIEDEAGRDAALDSFVDGWGSQDPEAALEWAERELDGDLLRSTRLSLASHLVSRNVEKATAVYEATRADAPAGEVTGHLSSLAESIGTQDPRAAASWLLEQPADLERQRAVQNLVDHWSRFDPMSASEFLGGLPAGAERDEAAEALINRINGSDPESAFHWASSIEDEDQRKNLLRRTLDRWKEKDEAAARQALDSTDLTEEARSHLTKRLFPE